MTWWDNDFFSSARNKLYLAGKKAEDLAAEYGTPLHVYGKKQIIRNYEALVQICRQQTFLESRIGYAMKANSLGGILRLLKSLGAWIDAVSPGEVEAALRAGFPPERILYTGTSVSREDLQKLFSVDGLTINIDAAEQLEFMGKIKKEDFEDKKIRISVRWNPGIGSGFHPRVITAGKRSSDGTPIKFGVEGKKVLPVFAKAQRLGFVPVGLHQHLGSGWVAEDFETVIDAADRMIQMAWLLSGKGFQLEFLDFGGGFGPRYSKNQSLFPLDRYMKTLSRKLAESKLAIGALVLEPGKYLVGNAGAVLLRVEYIKESFGNLFVCVNGGTYNTVPRPAIYLQAHHEIVNASCVQGRRRKRVTIAGNLCETGDVFGKERLMPLPKTGDIIAVLHTGAYCRSMASNFNLREIPREILI